MIFFTKNKANIRRQNIERKQEGEKETNKQRKKDKATTKEETTTKEPHKIFQNQDEQCDRSQHAQKRTKNIIEKQGHNKRIIISSSFLFAFASSLTGLLPAPGATLSR